MYFIMKINTWAQLFEGQLALNLGLNLTGFQKHFCLIIFSVIFRDHQSSTCWQKDLNWIYFLSFHIWIWNFALTLGYLSPKAYHSFKIFFGIWLPQIPRVIHHNQQALTNFEWLLQLPAIAKNDANCIEYRQKKGRQTEEPLGNEDTRGNLMIDLGKHIFKVIRWFCIAHLLLRITRWPPWKRASEVALLRCFDTVLRRPYRCFLIVLKVILSMFDRYKLFTNDWLWIEVCQNVLFSKIDITMTTINKKL